ncbi:hypothetical protein [Nostoc sp.]
MSRFDIVISKHKMPQSFLGNNAILLDDLKENAIAAIVYSP